MTSTADHIAVEEFGAAKATGDPPDLRFFYRHRRSLATTPVDTDTRAIEENREFYELLLNRIDSPGPLVDATEIFPDLNE
jgi:hypothetical protein